MESDGPAIEVGQEAQDDPQRILDLMFKITTEWFDMTSFPSRDGGPWDKAIRMQDLMIALHQRYVTGKESIGSIQESDPELRSSAHKPRDSDVELPGFD